MNLFRPDVDRIAGYLPGEQPQESGWVKLNTNENPYPPAPGVLAALETIGESQLRKYPHPFAEPLRSVLAERHGLKPEQILVTNGSDESLRLVGAATLEPGREAALSQVTYSLYKALIAAGTFFR